MDQIIYYLKKTLYKIFLELDIDVTKLAKYEYGKKSEFDIVVKEKQEQINNLVSVNKLPRGDYYKLTNLIQFYLDPDNNAKTTRYSTPCKIFVPVYLLLKLKIMEKILIWISTRL